MRARRSPRHSARFLWALLAAVVLEAGIGGLYELTRAPKRALVRVQLAGDGEGKVYSVNRDGIECGLGEGACHLEVAPGSRIEFRVVKAENSVFKGWWDDAGNSTCAPLVDQVGSCRARFVAEFAVFAATGDSSVLGRESRPCMDVERNVLQCEVTVARHRKIVASFAKTPDEVELVSLPSAEPKKPPEESKAIEVATPKELAKAKPLPVEKLLQKPKPKVAAAKPRPKPREVRRKAVEVPDENEVKEAPKDARFDSDKNRDVAKEQVARDTNLEKARKGEASPSEENDNKADNVGGKKDRIAQADDQKASSFDAKRIARDKTRGKQSDKPAVSARDPSQGSMWSTRGIEGREVPGGALPKGGRLPAAAEAAHALALRRHTAERALGKTTAEQVAEMGARTSSTRRGRWERKQKARRAALENFVSEVSAGNQTMLKTRANPFSVYIARMHRSIHELWGFKFINHLQRLSPTHPMNDVKLETVVEVAVNPDGRVAVDRVRIKNSSGITMFDLAAIDVIMNSEPFDPTPTAIRSVDGRVWLHWVFRRDYQQCGTFNVKPFVLNKVSGAYVDGSRGSGAASGSVDRSAKTKARSAARAANVDARDRAADLAANTWLTGLNQRSIKKLVAISATPFRSGERLVVNSGGDIAKIYRAVLSEFKRARIRDWKVFSRAGYRKAFGVLPRGIAPAGPELLLAVQLGKERITLVLAQKTKDRFKVTGLYR